jgi:hypothetical protein
MDSQPDWGLDFSPSDVCTHYTADGSVAAALSWAGLVVAGRLADAWPSTGALFRLTLTRHWCWRHRGRLEQEGYDPPLAAAALAEEGPEHPLWPAFDRSQRPPATAGEGGDVWWVAGGPPEPVGPDLEVVELIPAEVACTGHNAPPLTLLLRLTPQGWLVAGHGRAPVHPGWPPCR